jgi:hypothetical protein
VLAETEWKLTLAAYAQTAKDQTAKDQTAKDQTAKDQTAKDIAKEKPHSRWGQVHYTLLKNITYC